MKKVSVIGAGPAGLIFAYALLKSGKGYDVTVYSDRTADQWLNASTPTGTAYLYGSVIDIERELGMDFWSDEMFEGGGVLLDFKPQIDGDQHMRVAGSFLDTGGAIDQRLRVHRWLNDLESIGGKLAIEAVTPERLDEIAAASDLTILAAGKADLAKSIARDQDRSVYSAPQRNLCMGIVDGVKGWDDEVDFTPVKFNFYGDAGEYFWVPYTHKTAGPTWCFLWEAKAGGPLDKFADCESAGDAVEMSKQLIEKHAPWEWDLVKDMTPVADDPYSWLKGRFPPTVRKGFGKLPSGGLVMPIGDTAVTFDPIGGQGGNHASRNAKFSADEVITHGDGEFDEEWMQDVADKWWDAYAHDAYTFNNVLLEPLTEAGAALLTKSAEDRRFADQNFFGNFPRTERFFPQIEDAEAARSLIKEWDAKNPAQAAE